MHSDGRRAVPDACSRARSAIPWWRAYAQRVDFPADSDEWQEVYKFGRAPRCCPCWKPAEGHGTATSQIDWLLLHQANQRNPRCGGHTRDSKLIGCFSNLAPRQHSGRHHPLDAR